MATFSQGSSISIPLAMNFINYIEFKLKIEIAFKCSRVAWCGVQHLLGRKVNL